MDLDMCEIYFSVYLNVVRWCFKLKFVDLW